jgi:transposase
MQITRVGVDLAKNVFQVHGVNATGRPVLKRQLKRSNGLKMVSQTLQPGCEIGIEACGGSHHWARELESRGFKVKLIAPQFVKSLKNDLNDAEAVCEAISRPHMRFAPLKTAEQQDIQAMHRVRDTLMRHRKAKANQIRGLVAQFGDGRHFKLGRQAAASLGLTPRHHGTGGKNLIYGITKRGDPYLRSILIHGARAVVSQAKRRDDHLSRWVTELAQKRHTNVAAVALANKTARIAWAMLRYGTDNGPELVSTC